MKIEKEYKLNNDIYLNMKLMKIYFLQQDEIAISELEIYLKTLLKEHKHIIKNNSKLKRLIRIYDWLKYKK